jgi:predicted metal-dependent enzyme (double-stranded beta helix superfamily)
MSDISETRDSHVEELITQTHVILDRGPLDRARLDEIKDMVQALAAKAELWSEAFYPAPQADERQNRYRIGGDDETGITLYLNVMRSGKKIPPHDHTTWACIASVDGVEHNTLYERTDDGSVDGKASLRVRGVIEIAPGNSVAMMPDDIHSVEIKGDQIIRHLHYYGRPLETLSERKAFDMDAGTYKIMSIGVKTKA